MTKLQQRIWPEWVMALTLAFLAYAFALSYGSFSALLGAFAFFLAAWLLVVAIGVKRFVMNVYNLATILLLVAWLTLGLLVNQGDYESVSSLVSAYGHLIGFACFLIALAWVCSNLEIRLLLERLALALTPLLALIVLLGFRASEFSRLEPFGLQPNWWGELVVGYSVALIAVRNRALRWIGLMLGALVLFHVQSRSGMVGWAIAVLSEMFVLWKKASAVSRVLTVVVGLCLAAAFLVTNAGLAVVLFVSRHVMLLNNSYRGLGTGLTGRLAGWEDAISGFTRSPVLGRGLDSYLFVHNGFLQLLAEGGLVLVVVVAVTALWAIREALVTRNRLKIVGILAPAVYMTFQPRFFNLDITALLFWMSMLHWSGVRHRVKVPAHFRQRLKLCGANSVPKPYPVFVKDEQRAPGNQ